MLNESQKKKVRDIWSEFASGNMSMPNPSGLDTASALDEKRMQVIPQIRQLLDDYLSGRISMERFKSANDSVNKRQNLWGFKGMNGQMYFNMLYNSCPNGERKGLDEVLKACLPVPKTLADARDKIGLLVKYSTVAGEQFEDKRQAPRTGSCLFFASFFWQVQQPEVWPVYYRSMVNVMMAESLWSPTHDYPADYERFCHLNEELRRIAGEGANASPSLWDIEHAFWLRGQEPQSTPEPEQTELKLPTTGALPSSFVPPVISILPQLAKNDLVMVSACAKAGVSVEKTFEERLGVLFQMMGFQVESLGQGHGREPDGVATCREYGYGIVYDAKVRQDGYSVGTDDRAIREYIARYTERLRKVGIRNVYFAVISSGFSGEFDDVVRSLKIETDIREVLFIEVTALVSFLSYKLSNPGVDLGPTGLQGILVQSGVVSDADMNEYLGA